MSFHSTGGGTLARVNVVRDEHKTTKQLCNELSSHDRERKA